MPCTTDTSGFEAVCPVLAVSVEQYASDPKEAATASETAQAQARLLDLAADAFGHWQTLLCEELQRESVPPQRARALAALAVTSIEGTVAMCKAARHTEVLDQVGEELERAFSAAIDAAAISPDNQPVPRSTA